MHLDVSLSAFVIVQRCFVVVLCQRSMSMTRVRVFFFACSEFGMREYLPARRAVFTNEDVRISDFRRTI